jgi:hypothetical protein
MVSLIRAQSLQRIQSAIALLLLGYQSRQLVQSLHRARRPLVQQQVAIRALLLLSQRPLQTAAARLPVIQYHAPRQGRPLAQGQVLLALFQSPVSLMARLTLAALPQPIPREQVLHLEPYRSRRQPAVLAAQHRQRASFVHLQELSMEPIVQQEA